MIDAEQLASVLLDSGEGVKSFLKRHDVPPVKAAANLLLPALTNGMLTLTGSVDRIDHHYSHPHTVRLNLDFDVCDEKYSRRFEKAVGALEAEMEKRIIDLSNDFYRRLEKEYDYYTSDEQVITDLDDNEFYFDPETGEEVRYDRGLDISALKPEVQRRAIDAFKDVVMRDDNTVLAYLHDKGIRFTKNGAVVPKPNGVKASELESEIQNKVVDKYRNNMVEDDFWYEGVIEHCQTFLDALGFEGAEVSFSGFSSQGDGASFTCDSIDFKKYINNAILKPIKMEDV